MSVEAFVRYRAELATVLLVLVVAGIFIHNKSDDDVRPLVSMAQPRILCVGDSLTAGYSPGSRNKSFQPYATQLSESMVRQPNKVTPLGFCGFSAEDLMEHSNDEVLAPLTHDMQPGMEKYLLANSLDPAAHIVIILAGMNDMSHTYENHQVGERLLPCKAIAGKVAKLHNMALDAGSAATIALSLPNSGFIQKSSEMRECYKSVNEALESFAGYDSRVNFLQFPVNYSKETIEADLWDSDLVHLTSSGYTELGRRIAPEVDRILDSFRPK